MRKLRDLYFVIGLFLTVNCAPAAENSPFAFKAGDPDVVTIERTYTTSFVKKDPLCKDNRLSHLCDFLVDSYSRRFEREMVIRFNQSIDFDSPDFTSIDRSRSFQHVILFMHLSKNIPVATLYSFFKIDTPKDPDEFSIETFNYDLEKKKSLAFNELFEDSETAAMLCARAVQKKFEKDGSYMLPVVIAATELSPHNFIITKNGLRLFFAAGLLNNEKGIVSECDINIDDLKDAKPLAKFWPQLKSKEKK